MALVLGRFRLFCDSFRSFWTKHYVLYSRAISICVYGTVRRLLRLIIRNHQYPSIIRAVPLFLLLEPRQLIDISSFALLVSVNFGYLGTLCLLLAYARLQQCCTPSVFFTRRKQQVTKCLVVCSGGSPLLCTVMLLYQSTTYPTLSPLPRSHTMQSIAYSSVVSANSSAVVCPVPS